MACNDKIENTCGVPTYATCVNYEGTIPEFSSITDECVNMEEIVEDVYELIENLRDATDMTELDLNCLAPITDVDLKKLNQALIDEICAQKELITQMQATLATQAQQITALQNNICP